jgi:UDPglucose 6-dehydrogenase
MIKIKTIGIIGQGFVGNAVKEGLKDCFDIVTFDKISSKSTESSVVDLINKADVVFLCVPTPMKKTGECDISILDSILQEINNVDKQSYILIKSTISPGTTDSLQQKYSRLRLIFNPEFLTEANSINDYKNQTRIIFGGDNADISYVQLIFQKCYPKATIIRTSATIAEMIKYITNTFLATKISFANEIYQICDKLNIDYDKVIEYAKFDDRLGYSHWSVPGPDGDFGYGGHCFPKDISALKFLANSMSIDTSILDATINKNNQIRTFRDWELQKGRAVSE